MYCRFILLLSCFEEIWQLSLSKFHPSVIPSIGSFSHYYIVAFALFLSLYLLVGISPLHPCPRSQCSSYTNSKYGRENSCSSSSGSSSWMSSAHLPTSKMNLSLFHTMRPAYSSAFNSPCSIKNTPFPAASSTICGVSSFLRTPNSVRSSGSYQKIPTHGICSSKDFMSSICALWSLSFSWVISIPNITPFWHICQQCSRFYLIFNPPYG